MRLDVYGHDMGFAAVQMWNGWVVIGFDDAIHWVSLATKKSYSYPLRWYFAYLYPTEELLLVSSASELLCFDREATLRWRADDLGIDGVIVTSVESDVIHGEGEWNPPGDWRPFTLSLHSGRTSAE